uniref:DDE-1 domain-containing protein n=1 Tax=Syphacia muris TaxID=451379 RepID=A0A0N5ARG7_9BILA
MVGKRSAHKIDCIELPKSFHPEKTAALLRSASATCLLSDSWNDNDILLSASNGDERKTIQHLFHVGKKCFQRFFKVTNDKRDAYEPFSVKAMQLRDTLSHQRSEMFSNESYSTVFI